MAEQDTAIRVNLRRELIMVPATAFVVGAAIGIMRGGRRASLRFLAENAHRPPTTVQGWYFYKKTKNYKVLWGALKGAGAEAGKLTGMAVAYVGIEEGIGRTRFGVLKHVGAAVGTAAVFCAVGRLPLVTAQRTVGLALAAGGAMTGLDFVAGRDGR